MNILWNIYHIIVMALGNATLIILLIYIFFVIYRHFKMKSIIKKYAKQLKDNNFLKDAMGPMSDEEKKKMEETKYAKTTVSMDFETMKVKKETK